jgi:hypothetical protein
MPCDSEVGVSVVGLPHVTCHADLPSDSRTLGVNIYVRGYQLVSREYVQSDGPGVGAFFS